jgi:hypothetical protein
MLHGQRINGLRFRFGRKLSTSVLFNPVGLLRASAFLHDYLQFRFPASGIVKKVIVAGANLIEPAFAGTPASLGS